MAKTKKSMQELLIIVKDQDMEVKMLKTAIASGSMIRNVEDLLEMHQYQDN